MTEICEFCKNAVNQCVPHGKAVNSAYWGCNARDLCTTYDICDYFLLRLREEDLLKEPKK
jgi:hypothetical protein